MAPVEIEYFQKITNTWNKDGDSHIVDPGCMETIKDIFPNVTLHIFCDSDDSRGVLLVNGDFKSIEVYLTNDDDLDNPLSKKVETTSVFFSGSDVPWIYSKNESIKYGVMLYHYKGKRLIKTVKSTQAKKLTLKAS